jgi:chorismate-pyruvate lyase
LKCAGTPLVAAATIQVISSVPAKIAAQMTKRPA